MGPMPKLSHWPWGHRGGQRQHTPHASGSWRCVTQTIFNPPPDHHLVLITVCTEHFRVLCPPLLGTTTRALFKYGKRQKGSWRPVAGCQTLVADRCRFPPRKAPATNSNAAYHNDVSLQGCARVWRAVCREVLLNVSSVSRLFFFWRKLLIFFFGVSRVWKKKLKNV